MTVHPLAHPPSTCATCAQVRGVDGYEPHELRLFDLEAALAQVEREHAAAVANGAAPVLSDETQGLVRRLLGFPR